MEIVKSFYDTGQLEKVGQLENGKKQGCWTHFYENGQKRLETTYKEDKLDGPCSEWYENGQISEEGEYINAEYHVINFWLVDGNQVLVDGTGMTIRSFGTSQGDIYEQYFDKGTFTGEKKIAGVSYGQFTPNVNQNGS